jgi:hypothetical protein
MPLLTYMSDNKLCISDIAIAEAGSGYERGSLTGSVCCAPMRVLEASSLIDNTPRIGFA